MVPDLKTEEPGVMLTKKRTIPYGHQWIDEDDIAAVMNVLRSDWLTTGPGVGEFEEAFAGLVGSREAVAVSSGTAALHAAMYAADIGPGDEVILPPMTFAATANAVVFQGGTPVFADVDPDTLLIDPDKVEEKITHRTKAIVSVDYAGQPCDYDALKRIADRYGVTIIADSCHALGAEYKGRPAGSLADLNIFSFHPVKHITTGEGGMITTDMPLLAEKMRKFRNHGIACDHHQREKQGSWFYEMTDLGYNYRLTDIQCALGSSQLRKSSMWLARRRKIAERYDTAFAKVPAVEPLHTGKDALHAYHLYVVRFDTDRLRTDRAGVFAALRSAGVGVNVHYIPVHLHPFYRERFGTGPGLCPVAEAAYEQIISLPLFPGMDDLDVEYVIEAVCEVSERFGYSVDDTRKGYHFFGVGYPAERAPMPVCADHA
jgi:perosamine synthetase